MPDEPTLPALGEGDPELTRRLAAALEAKGPDYEARTRHVSGDGSPKYTNRLILETSPYLLQHAHNPVNWRAWGDEAFEHAKASGKPVLLSVGYSTCHWCHVMERESFEDEEVAGYINENYIAIKVDREERPDIDDIYMTAVNMLTGRGGWPMTVLLTPEQKPFFAGTYFPARDGDRGARKGFLTILKELAADYTANQRDIVRRATQLSQRIAEAATPSRPGDIPGPEIIERAAQSLAQSYDPTWGGFGRAPKFPRPVTLELLLRYHRRTGDAKVKDMVLSTLDKMAKGGMYDQIGGGFHRYSTDARWLVPHFEKMLYDNAQLVPLYLEAYQISGQEEFARVARETLRYVTREMTSARGGFFSATDADSPTPSGHEDEGYFFTWTPDEIRSALGTDEGRIVNAYFGVTSTGNFEGRSILHRPQTHEDVAKELGIKTSSLNQALQNATPRLYQARKRRPPPLRDEKIIASWNGLMISAFSKAALILDDDEYEQTATRAADFLLRELVDGNGRLLRTVKGVDGGQSGYIDDYAFVIQGLLDLYEATSELRWLEKAVSLQGAVDEHYWDAKSGAYFLTSDDHEALIARQKPSYDGAEPSGNSVAALNLLRLSVFTGQDRYRTRAERIFSALSQSLSQSPTASPKLLSALEFYLDTPLEVFVVAPSNGGDATPLVASFRRSYLPNRIFTFTQEGEPLSRRAALIPALTGKRALKGRPTAFVCERGNCQLPTSDPATFKRQLAAVSQLSPNLSVRPLTVPHATGAP